MAKSTFQKRRVQKALAKANELEAAAGRPTSTHAVQGTQKFKWSDGATIVVCAFAVVFVMALAAGYVITPGGLVLGLAFNAVKPRRTITVSAETVTIWKQSAWTGRVTEAAGVYPRTALNIAKWTSVADHPTVKLSDEEVAVLHSTTAILGVPPQPVVHTPPAPAMPKVPSF